MSSFRTSPRIAIGEENLTTFLRDLDIRLVMQEQRYLGQMTGLAVLAVRNQADLPPGPTPGDRAKVISTGTIYTANASNQWVATGAIP